MQICQLQKEIWSLSEVGDEIKLDFVKYCGEVEFHMIEGSDEFIQLESLLANLILRISQG